MRIVLSTVSSASVSIKKEIISSINQGYLLLVGFTHDDNKEIVSKMVDKLLSLRVFPDKEGLTNLSLDDVNGDILSVSQFTLYADVSDGRRPSFHKVMPSRDAYDLYMFFNSELRNKSHHEVKEGIFGEAMDVSSVNDGPFTLILDSKELFNK